jgi:hypothetical protein
VSREFWVWLEKLGQILIPLRAHVNAWASIPFLVATESGRNDRYGLPNFESGEIKFVLLQTHIDVLGLHNIHCQFKRRMTHLFFLKKEMVCKKFIPIFFLHILADGDKCLNGQTVRN